MSFVFARYTSSAIGLHLLGGKNGEMENVKIRQNRVTFLGEEGRINTTLFFSGYARPDWINWRKRQGRRTTEHFLKARQQGQNCKFPFYFSTKILI